MEQNRTGRKIAIEKSIERKERLQPDFQIITARVLGSKMQKTTIFFEENKCFESSFYRIEVQMITNPSSRLENPPNT